MADKVVLLNFKPSPYATRVRIALAEKGVEYETKEEDVFNTKSQLLQKIPHYYLLILARDLMPGFGLTISTKK
ncbi:hypothetical protein PTKIN_Ptkin19aG0090500 [Pterospermum kingtungense]